MVPGQQGESYLPKSKGKNKEGYEAIPRAATNGLSQTLHQ